MYSALEPLECPACDVASVPRRFGAGVLLVLMTVFAILFAAMRTFDARPEVFVIVAVLFLAVTLAQIVLFRGKQPRKASFVAGGVVFPLEILVLMLLVMPRWLQKDGPETVFLIFFFGLVLSVPGGVLFGYLAGCVMAGVFFVQEGLHRRKRERLTFALQPFTAGDFDTLIAWVHHPQLFAIWSQGEFRYPLDHGQLAAHLSLAADESANRLCFKLVCGEMEQMVGYAELANVDAAEADNDPQSRGSLAFLGVYPEIGGEKLRAAVELAIVDPLRNDRELLSGELVREIVQYAFDHLKLYWLSVVLPRIAVDSVECFCKHGFYGASSLTPGGKSADSLTLIRSNRY